MLKALQERNGFDTADVDDVVWGTSSQVMEQSGDIGRMSALDADTVDIPAVDAQTRQLFKTSITLATIVGLYLIWTKQSSFYVDKEVVL